MPKPRPYRTAAEREARHMRIVVAIQDGVSYDEIARAEAIGPQRVRQIVVETMRRKDRFLRDFAPVEAARLDAELKLTLQSIAAGKLEAVDRFLVLSDRLYRYRGRIRAGGPDRRERIAALKPNSRKSRRIPANTPLPPPRKPLKSPRMA